MLLFSIQYKALIGRMSSPPIPIVAKHLLLSCSEWTAKCERDSDESIDCLGVFQYYWVLLVFLISLGHLPSYIGMGCPQQQQ